MFILGESSKKSQEMKSDAGIFNTIQGDLEISDLKVTPTQPKKTRNSQAGSIQKLDTKNDDLCDLKTSKII